jgi:hypothetical protein
MPDQAFGYDTNLGIAEESTYGTYVAPTDFLEITSEGLNMTQTAIPKTTLNSAGEDSYILSKKAAGGPIEGCVPYQGMEILFKHVTGGTPTSVQIAATGVYTHTFILGEDLSTGLSILADRDGDAIGTAYAYTGSMISAMTLTQDVENQLMASFEFVSQDESKQAIVTPTYPASNAIDWTQVSTVTFGGTTVEASVSEFKLENPLATDRYKLGSRVVKGLGRADSRKVTGKIVLEFDDIVEYDLFRDSTETIIIMKWTGGIAAGSTPYTFQVTIPRAIFSGTTPNAQDSGPISFEMPFIGITGTSAEDAIEVVIENLLTSIA